jgi:hypothetical protein
MSTPTTPAVSSGAGPAVRLLLVAAACGVVAGVVIDLLTALVAGSDIGGDGWSLRGNGSLVVPFSLGTGVLAGGWTALALHAGTHPRWLPLGVGAGLIAVVLGASQVLFLALLGAGAGVLVLLGMVAAVVWMVAAPLIAVVRAPGRREGAAWHLAAAVVLTLGLLLGLVGAIPALG